MGHQIKSADGLLMRIDDIISKARINLQALQDRTPRSADADMDAIERIRWDLSMRLFLSQSIVEWQRIRSSIEDAKKKEDSLASVLRRLLYIRKYCIKYILQHVVSGNHSTSVTSNLVEDSLISVYASIVGANLMDCSSLCRLLYDMGSEDFLKED